MKLNVEQREQRGGGEPEGTGVSGQTKAIGQVWRGEVGDGLKWTRSQWSYWGMGGMQAAQYWTRWSVLTHLYGQPKISFSIWSSSNQRSKEGWLKAAYYITAILQLYFIVLQLRLIYTKPILLISNTGRNYRRKYKIDWSKILKTIESEFSLALWGREVEQTRLLV